MNKIIYILTALILLVTVSCNHGKVKQAMLPGISGKSGEVLVVIEKHNWDGDIGNILKDILMQPVPGLPQIEPLFNPFDVPEKAFTDIFKMHRNIVYTKIDNNVENEGLFVDNNKWAEPQLVIYITAKNSDNFKSVLNQNSDKLLGLLFKAERDRLMRNYKAYPEPAVVNKLAAKSGVKLVIPKGYTIDMDTTNFVWIAHETPDISQGIFVYNYPFTNDSTFTLNYLVSKRNQVLKQFVHGAIDGTYMTTETQVMPTFKAYNHNNQYTAELRGLWKLENGFMGGPFVSITRVDEKNNRIVTVEGYVYAPKFNKRNYMRQLEAIIYSFDWTNN